MEVNTEIKYGARPIREGSEFNHLISSHTKGTSDIWKNGNVHDTIQIMHQVVNKYYSDLTKLAQHLNSTFRHKTLLNIWSFVFNHIQYTRDQTGVEVVSRPARLWKNRKGLNGNTDCDCMSVFIGSILKNLNIPFKFRMVGYREGDFQHVYVIVPNSTHKRGYYILDAVVHHFDVEVPFTKNKDL